MSKLYVIGNCYSDNETNAKEIFDVLEAAGYTLGYNTVNKTAATILKEIAEEEPTEE